MDVIINTPQRTKGNAVLASLKNATHCTANFMASLQRPPKLEELLADRLPAAALRDALQPQGQCAPDPYHSLAP